MRERPPGLRTNSEGELDKLLSGIRNRPPETRPVRGGLPHGGRGGGWLGWLGWLDGLGWLSWLDGSVEGGTGLASLNAWNSFLSRSSRLSRSPRSPRPSSMADDLLSTGFLDRFSGRCFNCFLNSSCVFPSCSCCGACAAACCSLPSDRVLLLDCRWSLPRPSLLSFSSLP